MTPQERRSSLSLALIFALRMLGLFLVLPVFALEARKYPGGDDPALVGLAMGIYGLTQAVLQLPLGMASDRFGRKRVIVLGLLVFAAGSLLAAKFDDYMAGDRTFTVLFAPTERSSLAGWTFTANHVTRNWRYYLTKQDWNPNQPLTRESFESKPLLHENANGARPSAIQAASVAPVAPSAGNVGTVRPVMTARSARP